MKKQYKLIRTYPGSPKIGCIATINKRGYYDLNKDFFEDDVQSCDIEQHPLFWELVKQESKEWEILSFKGRDKYNSDGLFVVKNCETCVYINKNIEYIGITYESALNNGILDIHSIKRLSDGSIFTIGDNIKPVNDIYLSPTIGNRISKSKSEQWIFSNTSIHSFLIVDDIMCIMFKYNHKCGQPIHVFPSPKVAKQKLFTTEDGVDIFEGDKFYSSSVFNIINKPIEFTADKYSNQKNAKLLNHYWFSTKKAAEKYILHNKPCLSITDVNNSIQWKTDYKTKNIHGSATLNKLKELVKSKL